MLQFQSVPLIIPLLATIDHLNKGEDIANFWLTYLLKYLNTYDNILCSQEAGGVLLFSDSYHGDHVRYRILLASA